jgi:site-specific DNA-methyltransferase (adenine-specific)
MKPFYDHAGVTLWRGDCLSVMLDLPHGVDAIIADPPYGQTAGTWDSAIPIDTLWSRIGRVSKQQAAIVLFGSQPFSSSLVMSNPAWFRHEWIWRKNRGSNFANTVREPMKEHESILVFSRGGWTYNPQMQEREGGGAERVKYDFNHRTKTANYGQFSGMEGVRQTEMRVPSSVQKFNTETGFHPTQKPVALMEYLIRTYTNEGDTVLDFTCGSGTTGVACVRSGRKFIGIERETDFIEIAARRISQTVLPLAIAR